MQRQRELFKGGHFRETAGTLCNGELGDRKGWRRLGIKSWKLRGAES